MDAERELFERSVRARSPGCGLQRNAATGDYENRYVEHDWLGWQAGRAAQHSATEPNKLLELADRIDHEKLWRRPGVDRIDKMTPDQLDRLDAGVMLRRYADLLGSNDWRIYPPKPSISYRGPTLDAVVAMVRRTEQRRQHRDESA